MRLLGIADLHGKIAALEGILQAAGPVDAVLLAGDITHFGTPEQAEQVVRHVQAVCANVFAVAGNCDSLAICERLSHLGVSLNGRGTMFRSVGFHGLAAIPPWRGRMYQRTEDDLAESLQRGMTQIAQAGTRVLLTHVPPFGTSVDRVFLGRHCGSVALREFVEVHKPCLLVCGHIHESAGIETLGPTVVVNCGPASRGSYALADLTIHTDLQDASAGDPVAKVDVKVQLRSL